MFSRRSFLRLLAGAAAGMFAGKAGVEAATQPEIGLAETRGHCNLQLQIHRQACIENVRVYDYALSGAEVMQRYLELISDNPPTEGLVVWRTDGSPACWYPSSPPKYKCDICGRPAPYHWDDDLHWCPLHTDTVWHSSGGPPYWGPLNWGPSPQSDEYGVIVDGIDVYTEGIDLEELPGSPAFTLDRNFGCSDMKAFLANDDDIGGDEDCESVPFHHFTMIQDENGECTYLVEGVPVTEWSPSEVRRVLAERGKS